MNFRHPKKNEALLKLSRLSDSTWKLQEGGINLVYFPESDYPGWTHFLVQLP